MTDNSIFQLGISENIHKQLSAIAKNIRTTKKILLQTIITNWLQEKKDIIENCLNNNECKKIKIKVIQGKVKYVNIFTVPRETLNGLSENMDVPKKLLVDNIVYEWLKKNKETYLSARVIK